MEKLRSALEDVLYKRLQVVPEPTPEDDDDDPPDPE